MDKSPRARTATPTAPAKTSVQTPSIGRRKAKETASVLQPTLAKTIRSHRESLAISQEAFADLIGMHRTYYSAIERGTYNLTLKSLERVARGLGCKVSELIGEAERVA